MYKSIDDSNISDSQSVDNASNAEGSRNPQSSIESTVSDTGGPDESGLSRDTSEGTQKRKLTDDDDDHVAGNIPLRSSRPVSWKI